MFKKLLRYATTSALSLIMLSSYWELPYSGPCLFFFGEPEYPCAKK